MSQSKDRISKRLHAGNNLEAPRSPSFSFVYQDHCAYNPIYHARKLHDGYNLLRVSCPKRP